MYGRRYKVRTPVTTNDNFSLFYLSFIARNYVVLYQAQFTDKFSA